MNNTLLKLLGVSSDIDRSKFTLNKKYWTTINTDFASFYITDDIHIVEQVISEYEYFDLRSNDVVLDIGANIGAFSLKIRSKVKKVYALEPVLIDELRNNIKLNNVKNIEIIHGGLGSCKQIITWDTKSVTVQCHSFQELKHMCGGHIDVLKCDCEGHEWLLTQNDFDGIRRIELEIHRTTLPGKTQRDFLKILDIAGYEYTHETQPDRNIIVHAWKDQ